MAKAIAAEALESRDADRDVHLQELPGLHAKLRAELTPSWKGCHELKVLPQLGSGGPGEHWLYKYLENFNCREFVSALFRSLPFQFLQL